jgi:hypothetical protein
VGPQNPHGQQQVMAVALLLLLLLGLSWAAAGLGQQAFLH